MEKLRAERNAGAKAIGRAKSQGDDIAPMLAAAEDLGGKLGHLILARLAIDFRNQVHFGNELTVTTQVANVGTSSIRLQQKIRSRLNDLAVAAEVESVVVYFDYQANHPIPVPEGLRKKLDPFRVI